MLLPCQRCMKCSRTPRGLTNTQSFGIRAFVPFFGLMWKCSPAKQVIAACENENILPSEPACFRPSQIKMHGPISGSFQKSRSRESNCTCVPENHSAQPTSALGDNSIALDHLPMSTRGLGSWARPPSAEGRQHHSWAHPGVRSSTCAKASAPPSDNEHGLAPLDVAGRRIQRSFGI